MSENFKELRISKKLKRFHINTSERAVFSERFDRSKGDLHNEPVFMKRYVNWIGDLQKVLKKISIFQQKRHRKKHHKN